MDTDRARASLLGLAIGDAMGAPTEGMTRESIAARFGRVDGFLQDDAAGTDDTEYAVLSARGIIAHGRALNADRVAEVWLEALGEQEGGFYGAGFSEMVALANLRAGIRPPDSGRFNVESWSDGAAMRVAPIALFCAGDPELAARLAAEDASVSHAHDGIFCAQSVAAAVSVAATGEHWSAVVDAARAALPQDSWSARLVTRALDIATAAADLEEAERELYRRVPLFHYPWWDSGPEALALTLGVIVATRGEFIPGVLAGVNMGRDSDTIAAMVGAITGALHGTAAIPAEWTDTVRLVRGRCITSTAGTDLIELADAIVAAREGDRDA